MSSVDIGIGIIGLGTVGRGVVQVLSRNSVEIRKRSSCNIVIKHAATRSFLNNSGLSADLGIIPTGTGYDVIDNPNVSIVIELIGGIEPALSLIMRAISKGKHVVTANKALLAKYGNKIFSAAQEAGVMVGFEGAVAGSIPIVKAIREGFSANRVSLLVGIINGTTNFILSGMHTSHAKFNDLLKEAQNLGYTESDPSSDIDGIDAAHKLAIMASIAFGIPLQLDQVYVEGIRSITSADISNAEMFGYTIKHLSIAQFDGVNIQLRIYPALIAKTQLLASVNGVMNAVMLRCDAAGDSIFYGAGAGAEPTASAVLADVIDIARTLVGTRKTPYLGFNPITSEIRFIALENTEVGHYLRIMALDLPGVLANITKILANYNISVATLMQQGKSNTVGEIVPIILLLKPVQDLMVRKAINDIKALGSITNIIHIRLEEF